MKVSVVLLCVQYEISHLTYMVILVNNYIFANLMDSPLALWQNCLHFICKY